MKKFENLINDIVNDINEGNLEYVLDRFFFRIVPAREAVGYPSRDIAPGLSMMFCIYVGQDEGGVCSIRIDDNLLQSMGFLGFLYEMEDLAMMNTPKLFPADIFELDSFFGISNGIPVTVVTTRVMVNGASALLYPRVRAELKEKYGNKFLVLPSSKHAILIMPYDMMSLEMAYEMVISVNANEVSAKDWLADNVYIYDNGKLLAYKEVES